MISYADPIEVPWSEQTDANGNATHTFRLGNDFWYNLAVSGTLSGNATWVINRSGIFLRPAFGDKIHTPIGVCAPGTTVTLVIAHAPANVSISGMIYGNRAKRPHFLNDIGGIDDVAGANVLTAGQTFAGTVQAGLNSSATGDFPIPTGTASMLLTVGEKPPPGTFSSVLPSQLFATGDQTGIPYINYPTIFNSNIEPVMSTLISSRDTSISVEVFGPTSGSNLQIAIVGVEFIPVPLNFDIIDRPNRALGNVGITGFQTTPAPWQAPSSLVTGTATINGGSSVAILSPVANLRYYLHTVLIVTSTAAGSFAGLTDNSANQLVFGTTNAPNQVLYYDFKGKPLQPNVGVNVNNFGGAAELLYWTLTYTLAP